MRRNLPHLFWSWLRTCWDFPVAKGPGRVSQTISDHSPVKSALSSLGQVWVIFLECCITQKDSWKKLNVFRCFLWSFVSGMVNNMRYIVYLNSVGYYEWHLHSAQQSHFIILDKIDPMQKNKIWTDQFWQILSFHFLSPLNMASPSFLWSLLQLPRLTSWPIACSFNQNLALESSLLYQSFTP